MPEFNPVNAKAGVEVNVQRAPIIGPLDGRKFSSPPFRGKIEDLESIPAKSRGKGVYVRKSGAAGASFFCTWAEISLATEPDPVRHAVARASSSRKDAARKAWDTIRARKAAANA